MQLELEPTQSFGLSATAGLLNEAFSDYLVPIRLSQASLLQMVRRDSVDLDCSRVVRDNGLPVGVALVARRGWSSRLAGMALLPTARGQGIGRWCMTQLMSEARARSERVMELEVIEENTAAVCLYRGCGFNVLGRLLSYVRAPGQVKQEGLVEEVDVRLVARLVAAYGLPNLPWQMSGESLAHLGPPDRAYRMAAAYLVLSDPDQAQVIIRSILVEPEARRQGQASRLLRSAIARYPGKTWRVPALCPEQIGGLFEKAGFMPDHLAQLHMAADLT
jgi:ribosomal protein S18 acetylase RimI-like enzyme